MVRFGLLGAGRIGKIHGGNIAARRRRSWSRWPMPTRRGQGPRRGDGRRGAERRRDHRRQRHRRGADRHADRHPCRPHREMRRAGKAVFCEKPVDLDSKRIDACLKVVEAAKSPLMIGFNRRFDPNFAALKKRLDEGAVGEVEMVTIISRDPGPPPVSYIERSGGLYRDMMIHDFDMARFLLGEEPVEVHALGSVLVDPAIGKAGDVDTAMVMLKTASGKLCQISCSRRATYGYDQRLEVHGSDGMLRAGNIHETTVEKAGKGGFTSDPVQNFFLRSGPLYGSEAGNRHRSLAGLATACK